MDYYDGSGGVALFAWLVLLPSSSCFAHRGYVLGSWFLMKIFDKAGVQGRWRAWVPVYNTDDLLKLGDLNPWLVLCCGAAASCSAGCRCSARCIGLAAFSTRCWPRGASG